MKNAFRRCFVLACALSVWAVVPPSVSAEDEKPVVIVLPFKNESNKQEKMKLEAVVVEPKGQTKATILTVDRFTEVPRTLFESALVKYDGVSVVERKRLDALLKEEQFGGLIGKEPAEELAKKLGANRIVLGTITSLNEETRTFVDVDGSYGMRGMKIETTSVRAEISVRVVELPSGKILCTSDAKGSKTYSKTTFGGTTSSDRFSEAIKDGVAKISADEKFKAAISGKAVAAGLIEVEFAPTPDKCNIEIDGKYEGSTSQALKVQLKAGTEYKVRITKAGYKEFTAVIVAKAGLKITPELEANK